MQLDINNLNIKEFSKQHKKAFEIWNEGEIIDAWYDENNILCIKYESGNWWHYKLNDTTKQLEWW